MKKRVVLAMITLAIVSVVTACGGQTGEDGPTSVIVTQVGGSEEIDVDSIYSGEPLTEEVLAEGNAEDSQDNAEESSVTEESEEEELKVQEPASTEGMYRSELTGEWISQELQNQRPIAAMVDNEVTALDHYGVNAADVVYEMMNSTENGRVTRLMVVLKDWKNITRLGSIRSVRPTNFMVAAEYNAIICHDGGPFYIDQYVARNYTNNLSGGFARFSNGKAMEFTEYITYESYTNPNTGKSYPGLKSRIESSKYSTEYNDYYPGEHFIFNYDGVNLAGHGNVLDAATVELPFPHNSSKLFYNEDTQTYDYQEYGRKHVDPLDDNKVTSFKNVILQSCSFSQYDNLGYMIYNVVGSGEGYYLTEGKAIPVSWSKDSETAVTVFTDKETGKTIELNVGKTYVGIVPSDKWGELKLY